MTWVIAITSESIGGVVLDNGANLINNFSNFPEYTEEPCCSQQVVRAFGALYLQPWCWNISIPELKPNLKCTPNLSMGSVIEISLLSQPSESKIKLGKSEGVEMLEILETLHFKLYSSDGLWNSPLEMLLEE